jgi:hypothetical protein
MNSKAAGIWLDQDFAERVETLIADVVDFELRLPEHRPREAANDIPCQNLDRVRRKPLALRFEQRCGAHKSFRIEHNRLSAHARVLPRSKHTSVCNYLKRGDLTQAARRSLRA